MGNAGGPRSGGNFVEATGLAINPIHGALEVRLWYQGGCCHQECIEGIDSLEAFGALSGDSDVTKMMAKRWHLTQSMLRELSALS